MMKHSWSTYLILLAVFVLSIGVAYLVPMDEIMKAVVAAPGVIALLAALFQLMRDQAAFEKEQYLQEKNQQFSLGAASHMANRVFDKHVEFCEKYMAEIHETLMTLYREGDSEKALAHSSNLHELRDQYATWLTDEMNAQLMAFEAPLRKLGANARFIKSTANSPLYGEKRAELINSSYELWGEIIGAGDKDEVLKEHAAANVKKKVRAILDVEELTRLRSFLVKNAEKIIDGGT